MVQKCPNLEVLISCLVLKCGRYAQRSFQILKLQYHLHVNPHTKAVPSSPLLSSLPGTSLRELSLIGFDFISTELSSWLASHPTIEVLSLNCYQIDQSLVLPPDTLPRLKSFSSHFESTIHSSILNCTTSIPRPLESIMGTSLNDTFLDSLAQCGSGPKLKKLAGVSGDDLEHLITRLSSIAPNLEWLEVQISSLHPIVGILFDSSYRIAIMTDILSHAVRIVACIQYSASCHVYKRYKDLDSLIPHGNPRKTQRSSELSSGKSLIYAE